MQPMNKKLSRVIFCANQVSLCIAVALAQKDRVHVNTIVFYMPARCDSLAYQDCGVELIPYSKLNFVKFLITTMLCRPDEVCVPHMITGRLINAYVKYSRVLSAIDDGMDTFREKPRNIVPEDFSKGAKYYTFTYDFPLATWLDKFSLKKICDICQLELSAHPELDTSEIDWLIVESPGVIDVQELTTHDKSRLVVIKHPNYKKNTLTISSAREVVGNEIALEKTIKNFSGTLFVGESMVLVHALLCGATNLKLKIMLIQSAFENLKSLHRLFDQVSVVPDQKAKGN